MNTMRRVLIFGATSAIAHATARLLVQQGCSVYAVGRNPLKLGAVLDDLRVRAASDAVVDGTRADLDNVEEHPELFELAATNMGSIDVVFIAHGTLPDQASCEASAAATLTELHTNALSPIAIATLAANHFQAKSAGMIVAISSVAGDRGRQSNYVYGSAKGAFGLFLQGLRNRLARHNVHVLTIKPGFVDTPMTAGFDKKGLLWATPEQVAHRIVSAMKRRRDVVYTPWFWRWIMLIIRSIPERLFKHMKL
ncbi:MAG: SDR family oxidoreductase [Gammaproteobacteria bacterium]|jgi:decaprenylphospho-beta-D-erythro-pentofuranosid-2-ulose 2-reductase